MAITSKKTRSGFIAIIFFVLLISIQATAQNEVAIGSNTTKSNAILWLNGNGSQGLILPVVTNKSAVSNPDKGMVVFDDSDDKVYYHSGAAWVEVGGGGGASSNPSLLLEGNQLQLKDGTTVKSTVNLAAGTQSNGAFLVFTGGSWQYATLSGDVTGANGALQVNGVKGKTIPALPTTTQALVYDGTAWKFQALTAGTDSQTLTFTSPNLSISNGNSVNLSTLDKDAQILSLTGNSLSISGGNSVNLPASGTVTSITAGAGLTGGTITNSGTINVDVGTTANKIVQLDGTGKLPAVDGSQLTNLAGDISAVTAGTGLTGGATTGAATLNVDVGTTANKIVQLDGTGKLPAVDGSQLTNLAGGGDITGVTVGTGLTGGGLSGSVTIAVDAGTTANKIVQLDGTGRLPAVDGSQLTNLAGDITAVTAGTGLTGGATTGAATLNVDVGTTANKVVQLDGTGRLPAVDGSQIINLNASNITSGTLPLNRLTTGLGGTILTMVSGVPTWSSPAASFTNPMTTAGDIIYGGLSGAPTRLAGTTGILKSNGTTPTWGTVNLAGADITGILPVTNGGTGRSTWSGLLLGSGSTISDITTGTAGQVLKVVGTTPSWQLLTDANIDPAAAINGSKIIPNFGTQALTAGTSTTFGTLSYTWPGTAGAANSVLTNNGSGALSWSAGGWGLTGNGGTNPATNFIGTTDAQPLRFVTGGTERMRIGTGTVVGIGTTNPLARFHIKQGNQINDFGTDGGFGSYDAGILIENNSTADAYYMGYGWSGNFRLGHKSALNVFTGILGLTANGGLALGSTYSSFVAGSPPANGAIIEGSVGIGTLTPAAKLDIAGTIKITDGSEGAGKVLTSDANGLASWQASSASFSPANTLIRGNSTATAQEASSIFDNGTFTGINRTTAVTGNDRFSISTNAASNVYGGMYIDTQTGGWPFYGYSNNGSALAWTYLNGTANTWNVWYGGADRLSVTSTGNVGIGTTTPTAKLEVENTTLTEGLRVSTSRSGTGQNRGIIADASGSTSENVAVYGSANIASSSGIGVYGEAIGSGSSDAYGVVGKTNNFTITTGNAYGIYGSSTASAIKNWAGYFAEGDVHITNALSLGATPGNYGTAGQVLTSAGAGLPPTWTSASGTSFSTLNTIPKGNGTSLVASSIFDDGNVGIGTTSPTTKLHVQGPGNFDIANTEGDFKVGNGTHRFKVGVAYAGGGAGDVYMGAQGGTSRLFIGGGTTTADFQTLTVAGGKVGIGTTTPNAPLQFPNTVGRKIVLFEQANNDHEYIGFGVGGFGTLNYQLPVNSNDHVFLAATSATTSNELMRIKGIGNVGIGTSTPAAKLDIAGTIKITDGSQGAGKVLTSDANGLASWQTAGSSTGWTLAGNTVSASDYIGTNNNLPFNIKVNNVVSGTINPTSNNTFFGYGGGKSNPAGTKNSGFGDSALDSNTTGNNNAGFGFNTLTNNLAGSDNTAFGYQSMNLNTNAGSNTAIGRSALFSLAFANGTTAYDTWNTGVGYQALYNTNPTLTTNGIFNTALGFDAGNANTTGDKNTFIGANAGPVTGTLSNANAIGYNAKVSTSNSLVLGGTGSDAVKVGVGTTAPNYLLQLNDVANVQAGLQLTAGTATGTTATDGLIITSNASAANILNRDATNLNLGTSAATRLTISSTGNIGLGNTSPNAQVQLGTTTANRKLVLYDVNNDDHQFYGFGVQSGEIRYQTQSTLSNHRFYAGTSSTTSALLMTISGAGNVAIAGSLSKGSGTFKIDHPLDPENKFLYHSFVESPDMMNVYNGNVQTDAEGNVVVTLPEYFEALNKDFRYQLTVIGQFAQAIVMEELKENKFSIKTDKPNVKVSWQVTGIRKDPFAEKNRVVPEVEKAADEKGKYLHPEAYGQPTEKKIGYENHELKQE